ncbi:MAG TPA: glycosyltransferase [Coleofasciculaceae cyanobacterium]
MSTAVLDAATFKSGQQPHEQSAFMVLSTWGLLALSFLGLFMAGQFASPLEKVYLVGLIGLWRYSWQLIHLIRSKLYLKAVWPLLRQKIDAHPEPFPRRLYFLIPSYQEMPTTTEKMLHSVIREALPIADQVQVTVVISMASEQERALVRGIVQQFPEAADRLNIILMHQQDGKRMAIGQGLRAIARDFHDPRHWQAEDRDDLVILMDGDSVLEPGFLRKTLPVFKIKPDLAAVTTHNEVVSPRPGSLMHQWYKLKFAQRHFLFSSHSLSDRVLTLTGRLSIYRADNILNEKFIGAVESDHVDHWLFGRCPFLMGDDKSTWYTLLKQGCKMLYIPDAKVYCLEERTSRFFKTSTSLFSRWYGNMLNNNGRAVAVGPRKLGFFIWWCLIDQKLTCWTPLIGPASMLILAVLVSPNYLVYYAAWVIISRSVYLVMLTGYGLRLNLAHLPLLIYNQWYGAILKLITLSRRDLQSWRSKNESVSDVSRPAAHRQSLSFPVFREIARYAQLLTSFSIPYVIACLLIFGVHIPESLQLFGKFHQAAGGRQEIRSRQAAEPVSNLGSNR